MPVPEEFAVPAAELDRTLAAALKAAEREGVAGRELTPFLLSSMSQANCFIVLPSETGNIAAGELVDVQLLEGLI